MANCAAPYQWIGGELKYTVSAQPRWLFWLGIFASLLLIQSCATGQIGEVVNHSFKVEKAFQSNKNIEYIGYCYGEPSDYVSLDRAYGLCELATPTQRVIGGADQYGAMRVRKTMWVKWRNLQTGQIFEESVDLQKAWPSGFQDWTIYAYVKNDRLQVFLIGLAARPKRPFFQGSEGSRVDDYVRLNNIPYGLQETLSPVYKIYPERQIDPHLPPDLRRKK